MATHQDNALRLMVIDDSMEEAEAIVSALRNAGIAVRPLRPASLEELEGMFSGQGIDLVLAALGSATIPLEEVARQLQASGKDVPLLAVADSIDSDSFISAHRTVHAASSCATTTSCCSTQCVMSATTSTPAACCACLKAGCARPSAAATR